MEDNHINVLIVTSEWPSNTDPLSGIHIQNQVARLKQAGFHVEIFSFRGQKNVFRYIQAIRKFRMLPLRNYDIIHAHHGQSGLIALAQTDRPVVVTFHGSDLQGIRNRKGKYTLQGYLLRAVSRWVAGKANEVIIVSEHLSQYLPDRSFHVIPAGIDTELFSPIPQAEGRKALSFFPDENLVLFVGDPNRPEKRYWLAKEVIDRVNISFPVRMVLADGIPNEQMPLYMNACDALLVTSANEGSPNAVKEALACGLPVVSVDVGDIRMRIGSIPECAISQSGDPDDLASKLIAIVKAKQRIRQREMIFALDEKQLVQQVIAVYQHAISEKGLLLSSH
ncbi:MAG: glycosyltransferase [Chloroflexi bacterium]|nr:glycosyltransferase [Chloroflexota bacterium]